MFINKTPIEKRQQARYDNLQTYITFNTLFQNFEKVMPTRL
jgi:hypothetical protein